jgi:DNA repair protein RecO (recombination protein O)
MEWEAPAIVLAARPYGEGDALATILTAEHGAHRGLARGGASRSKAATWQPGNLLQVRWLGRLPDQLGAFTAELVHPGAALAMDDALALAVLSSACAVAEGALTEREPHPLVFTGLLHLITHLSSGPAVLTDLVRWELALLGELGYGLDLATCALTGTTEGLAWVSPRTGRAVSAAASGPWKGRLLALPAFLQGGAADPTGWVAGLALTGHFLARDAFGTHHRPLPPARHRLADRVAAIAAPSGSPGSGS